MRVMVIGSEGNIGKPLVSHLKDLGHEVFTVDIRPAWRPDHITADITHPLDLLSAFEWKPDVVYLAAAMVSRVTCEASPSLAITTNVAGTANVASLCRRFGARLVYFSTSEVYGPSSYPMDEDGSLCNPNNRYGLSKLLGEKVVEYEVERGLDAITVRPFMIYGEDEDSGDHRSFMIRCSQALLGGNPMEIHAGTSRSWMHIDDAVVALERVLHINGGYTRINIGHPRVWGTEDVAALIREASGAPESLLMYIPQPIMMTPEKIPNLSKQENLLRFTPSIELPEGVIRLVERERLRRKQ